MNFASASLAQKFFFIGLLETFEKLVFKMKQVNMSNVPQMCNVPVIFFKLVDVFYNVCNIFYILVTIKAPGHNHASQLPYIQNNILPRLSLLDEPNSVIEVT